MESPSSKLRSMVPPDKALLMTSFSLDPSRISAGDLDAVVGIRSFRISEGDGASISRLELPSVNVRENSEIVIGACDGGGEGGEGACGGRGESVTPRSRRISRCGGIVEMFLYSRR